MKKFTIISIITAFMLMPLSAMSQTLVKEYHNGPNKQPLEIDVWVDNEDGIYYKSEEITIFFQADRDCFAAIYSVDTRGDVNLLFPENPRDDGFIEGGELYSIPGGYSDYSLIVSGPEGIEHIQAVASVEKIEMPRWYDGANITLGAYEDPEDFIEEINERYFKCRRDDCLRAYDHTSIYVKTSQYYYQPVYVPTHWYDDPYYSMIYIDYPYGGEIYVDGIFIGIAPLWVPRIVVGWHWFTIYDRFGYCWEHHMNVHNNTTIYFDRTVVKTSRSKVSRYKDVRTQSRKYRKSDYVLSEKRLKTTRTESTRIKTDKFSRPGTGTKLEKGTSKRTTGSAKSKARIDSRKTTKSTKKTGNRWDSWNTRKSDSRKTDKSRRSNTVRSTKRETSKSPGKTGSSKSSKVIKKSGGSKKSTAPAIRKSGSPKSIKSRPTQRSTPAKKKGGGSSSVKSSSKSSGSHKSSGGSKSGSVKSSKSPKSSSSSKRGGYKKR
ncbi:MAG: DUF4384 domain-containing protein [candidate division Zixibacteria bacterium]